METIKLINVNTDQVIADDVKGAYSFWTRLKGLMFTKRMSSQTGLHISPCTSIHTFFMNFRIDILYLNKANEIVGVDENMETGKIGKRYLNTKSVVELPAGTIKETSTVMGHTVAFVD
ncbi:DUF192 domain-containing protein [Oceanobacillus halotolerans]|uniref:DUF192 domain-containing protein n=1 Tax=Oceanobacillus halotolerans TaxID=2663380 RepID=UPI0013DA2CE0|nr:DUF192 domain-containing protein [Oceanobacillus halotolerans]